MIHCEGLVKIFKSDDVEVVALQGLNLTVAQGEMMAIIGNSGSGKSTLLNILGGLDRPSAGQATVGSWNLLKMTDEQLIEYKRKTVGFIWQNNGRNLVPYLTALQNVELPMLIQGKSDRAYAKQLLDAVGLSHRTGSRLTQLSGGEQQRVAIAIALANRPQLVLADEPTGSVDSATGEQILSIFRRLNRDMGVTIVIVTHDLSVADKVDRVVAIRDGLTSTEWVRRVDRNDEIAGVTEEEAGNGRANAEDGEAGAKAERAGAEYERAGAVVAGAARAAPGQANAHTGSASSAGTSSLSASSGVAVTGFPEQPAASAAARIAAMPGSRFGARHEEFVVIDRLGRLQVPKEYLDAMHVRDKAVLEFDGSRVIIRPPQGAGVDRADGGDRGDGDAGTRIG